MTSQASVAGGQEMAPAGIDEDDEHDDEQDTDEDDKQDTNKGTDEDDKQDKGTDEDDKQDTNQSNGKKDNKVGKDRKE